MSEELVKRETEELAPLTVKEIQAHVQLIQQVLAKVMKRNEHYGTIPGTPKPTLFKAGAEKIMATFRLVPVFEVADLSDKDCVRYRITTYLKTFSGSMAGAGVGEASTDEEKWRWKRPVCDAEFDETPEDRRRLKFSRDGRKYQQIRTQPADLANTVLKMAKKRSLVDAILTCTAASDIFAQDLDQSDEVPYTPEPEHRSPAPRTPEPAGNAPEPPQDAPGQAGGPPDGEESQGPPKRISEAKANLIYKKLVALKCDPAAITAYFNEVYGGLANVPASEAQKILDQAKSIAETINKVSAQNP